MSEKTNRRPRANYERHKQEMNRRGNEASRDSRNIGPPPPVVNPPRRAEAFGSLRRYAEIYFPQRFSLAWSPDHLQVLWRMEEAIRHGGLFALAMARGGGKTSISEVGALWATMSGLHMFLMLLAVSATRAGQLLAGIKTELLTNDLLFDDFPEVCHPVRCLEDRANRAKGQHIDGQPTYIGWKQTEIILPTVEGSQASGAVLRVAGMTSGSVRGPKHVRPDDGRNVRPSLAILDDPQDDKSARSEYQCDLRHQLLHGAILGMAGPGKKITAVCPCTVIHKNDLAHRLLDRKQSPLWTGQRYQLLPRFPERMDLWQEYAERRADELRNDGDGHLATAWYGNQKEIMDRGAIASWPERFNPDELGAVQHAMNLFFLDKHSFASEYQNDPLPDYEESDQLTPEKLAGRFSGLARGIAPLATSKVVAFIDVQQLVLFWMVAGFREGFGGSVLDYGSFPDQQRPFYSLANAERTLAQAFPGHTVEAAIDAGLTKFVDRLLAREWKREDGEPLKIERLLPDAGFQTETVKTWCRRTPHAALIMPSHGRGIGAKRKPFAEYVKHPGEQIGLHWMISKGGGKQTGRHLLIDTNYWKTLLARRLQLPTGDKGAITFFGDKTTDHRLLVSHLCAEKFTRVEAEGRIIDEWDLRPERPDNHFLDCLVGCAAAASVLGVQTTVGTTEKPATTTATRADYDARRREFEARRGF